MAILQDIRSRSTLLLYEFLLVHKGFHIPVTAYLIEEKMDTVYYRCVCFEKTRIETELLIDRNESGDWYDMLDRDDSLAVAIGSMIDAELEKSMAYKTATI